MYIERFSWIHRCKHHRHTHDNGCTLIHSFACARTHHNGMLQWNTWMQIIHKAKNVMFNINQWQKLKLCMTVHECGLWIIRGAHPSFLYICGWVVFVCVCVLPIVYCIVNAYECFYTTVFCSGRKLQKLTHFFFSISRRVVHSVLLHPFRFDSYKQWCVRTFRFRADRATWLQCTQIATMDK